MPSIDFRGHLTLARTGFLAQIADPLTVYRMGAVGSMVAQSNDRVRQLYWEAILSVPRELVSDDDLSHGIADFMRRVIFRAVRKRRIGLLQEWAPRVFAASPYGRLRTSTLVAASVIRIACKEMLGRVSRGWGGHRAKVLYRR